MNRKPHETEASKRTGRVVALLIAVGLGGTVAFNVMAIAAAVRTDSGMVTDNYYQKSLVKDPEDTRREQFAALGWRADLRGPAVDGRFELALRDFKGRPVRGAAIATTFFRTTQAGFDKEAALSETAPGLYSGQVAALAPGQYEARFRIRHAAQDLAWHRRVVAPVGQ